MGYLHRGNRDLQRMEHPSLMWSLTGSRDPQRWACTQLATCVPVSARQRRRHHWQPWLQRGQLRGRLKYVRLVLLQLTGADLHYLCLHRVRIREPQHGVCRHQDSTDVGDHPRQVNVTLVDRVLLRLQMCQVHMVGQVLSWVSMRHLRSRLRTRQQRYAAELHQGMHLHHLFVI